MEFLDNTGHIFSLPSYDEKPIGYEFEEQPYIFWFDANYTDKLSVNNYYAKTINLLYRIDHDENIDEFKLNKKFDIEIKIENSNIFSMLKPIELNNLLEQKGDLKDYIEIIRYNEDDKSYKKNISTDILTNDDLLIIRTSESVDPNNNNQILNEEDEQNGMLYDFLLIPLYILSTSKNDGTWISNILVHITNNETLEESWTPISIGAEYGDECEELVINGQNMGVNIPKGILKAIYQTSYINSSFNATLYNEKIKEYLFNYMTIKGEFGNFDSVINGLKWFGYGKKLTITKLLQTDNEFKEQYIYKHFDILHNILNSFKAFRNTTYISIQLATFNELDETYPFVFYEDSENILNNVDFKDFFGENKPKLESLLDKYIKVNVGHDLDIIDEDAETLSDRIVDREKYWYWKPYFDFTFNELGLKLACLKYYFEKYFLPIHLSIHNISLTHKVFANDIKFTVGRQMQAITEKIETLWKDKDDVKFLGNGIHFFTKQIHWLDQYFNEYNKIDDNYENAFYLNDTCTNIPIKFINNEQNKGYFNCVMLLERKNSDKMYYEYYLNKNIANIINEYYISKEIKLYIDNIDVANVKYAYCDNKDNINYSIYLKNFEALSNNIYYKYLNEYYIIEDNEKDYIRYIFNNNTNKLNDSLFDIDELKILYKIQFNKNVLFINFSSIYINEESLKNKIYNSVKTNFLDYQLENILSKIKVINFSLDNSFYINDKKYYVYTDQYNEDDPISLSNNNTISLTIFSDIYVKFITDTLNIDNIFIYNSETNKNEKYDIKNINYYIKNNNELLYESSFNFYQDNNNIFKNFVIYPKMIIKIIEKEIEHNNVKTYNHFNEKINVIKNINYWINSNYILHLLVNNKWYEYNFSIQMPEPSIDLGTIRYKYWLNDNNYILNNIFKNSYNNNLSAYNHHILAFIYNNTYFLIKNYDNEKYFVYNKSLNEFSDDNNDFEEFLNINEIVKNMNDVTKTSLLYKYIEIINKRQLMDYIYNMTSCYISNFNQILAINTESDGRKSITFNSFMHHPDFVNLNYINWDRDYINIFKYNINNNLEYIDKSIINDDDFYYYIEIENDENGKHFYQKIYIHKSNIGKNIKVPEEYFNDIELIYVLQSHNFVFILSENGENDSEYLMLKGFFISAEYDEYENEVDVNSYNGNITGIEINSSEYIEFEYDEKNNCYKNNGILYYLKESLHNNLEHVFENYQTNLNIPNNNKYLNSLHIFDLYKKIIKKQNVLIFHNNIEMTTDGIVFIHEKYDQYATDDEMPNLNPSVKFDIYGLSYFDENNDANTTDGLRISDKYRKNYKLGGSIDNYSLKWNKFENDLREDYDPQNFEEYPFVESVNDNIYIYYQKIDYDGKETNEYTLDKFTDYNKKILTNIGYDIFSTEQDFIKFWKNNSSTKLIYRNFIDNDIDIHIAKEELTDNFGNIVNINDLYIILRGNIILKVEYYIEYVTYKNENNVIEIENYDPLISQYIGEEDKNYKVKIIYKYRDVIKVNNKEIRYYGPVSTEQIDGETCYYFIKDDNQKIYLKKLKGIQYFDKRPSKEDKFDVRNQNPAMYWLTGLYNIDNDTFEELDRSLNMIHRYWGKLDENNNIIDHDYHFKNYLMKDITGMSGKFNLCCFNNITNETLPQIKLCVAITNENGETITIDNTGYGEYGNNEVIFELTGKEKEVIVFFQLDKSIFTNNTDKDLSYISIYPYIYKLVETYEKVKYLEDYTDEEYIICKINNKEYKYGCNKSQDIIKLYEDFFDERFTIYDIIYDKDKKTNNENDIYTNSSVLGLSDINNIVQINKIRSLYKPRIELDLNFDYDLYLMHNNEYWYCIFISQETIDKANTESDLILDQQEIHLMSKDNKTEYMLKFVKSDKQFLINRMEYVTSYPKYHFNNDDLIVARILNNNRLPVNTNLGSKWNIKPLSIGVSDKTKFESNSEMTIISIPQDDNKYIKGYYDISLQYSLDRDIQHQNKKSITFRIN